ncbi:hypothetical protein [Streptomyces chartreusis]|uniref:hypothetical protein n=1 Tax=Streptomyces chartreusis TaxID=1969 RepID=UPI0037F8F2B2
MIAKLLAHLALFSRHRHTVIVGGYHWGYCSHRSHRLRLPCWRFSRWDGYCTRHNNSCWGYCGEAT